MKDPPFPLGRQEPQSFHYSREKRMLDWYRHPTGWLEVHVEVGVPMCTHVRIGMSLATRALHQGLRL